MLGIERLKALRLASVAALHLLVHQHLKSAQAKSQ
jgi:hypothetical protein